MSLLGRSTQLLSRCGTTWLKAIPIVAPMAPLTTVPLCRGIRHVSTTKPKKAQAMKEATAVPIVKAPKASAPAKTRKTSAKATATAAPAAEKVAKTAKKTEAAKTRAVKPKPPTAEGKPWASAKKAAVVKDTTIAAAEIPETATSTTAPSPKAEAPKGKALKAEAPKAEAPDPVIAAAKPKPAASGRFASTPRTTDSTPAPKVEAPAPPTPGPQPTPASEPIVASPPGPTPKARTDTSSPEYKRAARKWTATMIALPILLVTSYYLYDRLVLGNQPSLDEIRRKTRGESDGVEVVAPGDAAVTSNTA